MTTRVAWAAACATCALLLGSFFLHPLGPVATLLLIALAILGAVRPFEAFLLLVAFAPLSTILFFVVRVEADGLRFVEGLTLAYLTGWTVRCIRDPQIRVPGAFAWSAFALAVGGIASGIIAGAVMLIEEGGTGPWAAVEAWYGSYAIRGNAITAAALFAEGPLLAIAAAAVCASRPERRAAAVRMTVIGAAAAAFFTLSRILIDGALFHERPLRRFVDLLLTTRLNVHHADINAAGSYFALAWFLALGVAIRERVAGAVCLLLITGGLWMTGSRVAIVATVTIGGIVLLVRPLAQARRKTALITLAALILAGGAMLWNFPLRRHVADPSLALRIRMGLARGAIAMAADYPIFGVGVGRFYELSQGYVEVPNYIVRENAHNNFLQILAELGLPGLWLFLITVILALAAISRESADMWPIGASIAAYLLTCLGGHPLLIPIAAVPFWMTLGIAMSNVNPRPHRFFRVVAILLILFFGITLPVRVSSAMRRANLETTSVGLSAWQRADDGTSFRWATNGRATFYVPSSARVVTIPLRLGADAPTELELRIFLEGDAANRLLLRRNESWRPLRLILPQHSDTAFLRLDFEMRFPDTQRALERVADEGEGILMIGRPVVQR